MRPSTGLAALALVALSAFAVSPRAGEDAARGYAEAFARALASGNASTLRPLLSARGKVTLRLSLLGPASGAYSASQVEAVFGDFLRHGKVESFEVLRVEGGAERYALIRGRARLRDREGRPSEVELQLALESEDGRWVAREIRESPR